MGSEEKPDFVTNANVEQKGYEQLTGPGLHTLTPPVGADKAVIQIEGKDARMRDDGTPPTALLGVRIKTSDPPFVYEADLSKLQIIETGGGAGLEINVLYYKNKGNS